MDPILLKYSIATICLGINAITDFKSRDSYTVVYLLAYALFLLLSPSLLLIILFILTLIFNRDNKILGGGDMDAVLFIFYILGISKSLECVFIACLFAIAYWIISKKEEIPFVTMLFLGFIITIIQNYY